MDKVIIVASTHWDREWYRTFQDFQIRLCDMLEEPSEQLFGSACEIQINAAPKKIITLQIIWR